MLRPAERPIGVTLIAILLAVNGVVVLVSSIGAFGPAPGGTASVVIGVIFGLALLYLAYGLWTLQLWAWWATVALEGLNAIFSLLAIFVAPGAVSAWVSLILAAVIVGYLLQPSVRDDFQRRAGA
ncbi:MAG: hypothetical protein ACM3US_07070 [Sphingomonadaceae bacterium]